jgi:hypothetical protein
MTGLRPPAPRVSEGPLMLGAQPPFEVLTAGKVAVVASNFILLTPLRQIEICTGLFIAGLKWE